MDKDLRNKLRELRGEGMEAIKIRAGKIIKNSVGGKQEIVYQPTAEK